MQFSNRPIEGMLWKPLQKVHDARGWLCELFRDDELPLEFHPAMGYVSASEPGIVRGPHEHLDQADYFCFIGPSTFKVYLWDNRPDSPTYRAHETVLVGDERPMAIGIPAGIVHAYKNVGGVPGLVYNFPNRLYKGPSRRDPVDEIRYEDDELSPFRIE
jgi:dTDP-4-dehydrorhamnose 3,5-epimerase